MRTFHLKVTIADESANISAWCTGHAATELLQISPDEFDELPEVLSPSPSLYYLSVVVYAKTMFLDACANWLQYKFSAQIKIDILIAAKRMLLNF